MVTRSKCFICDNRPATVGIYCHNCYGHIQAEIRKSHESRRVPNPQRYVTYQDKVIAIFDQGGGMGKYQASNKLPEKLPKAKTINLNVFCPDLNRDEVKRLKRLVLSLNDCTDMVGVTYEKSKSKGEKANGD
jgi:ribosomal protein L44E